MQKRVIRQPNLTSPGPATGFLIGAMLTAALIAVSYCAWRLGGLPFAAFDAFDWVARNLPGPVVTSGIDLMVKVVRTLQVGPTSEVAKTAEQALAIVGMWLTGTIACGLLFALLRLWRVRWAVLPGALAGFAAGALTILVSQRAGHKPETGPGASAIWIAGTFLIWGSAVGWCYQRLQTLGSATRVDRRRFLFKLGGVTAAGVLSATVLGKFLAGSKRTRVVSGARWSDTHPAPNAGARVQPPPGVRPEFTPLDDHYRIDINTIPPDIRQDTWRLGISGLVENHRTLTIDELRNAHAPLDQFVTLACISNPVGGDLIGTQRWTGISIQHLLSGWRLLPAATHLKIRSADGFFEILSLETINADERVMLTYAWDGVPLTRAHGFPLRLYIPDHYGMKQPKWIESIEATDHWEAGYWVERGWDKNARMQATSVIDTSDASATIIETELGAYAPIGGVAHAGARGISKVEVQVDGGAWQEAQLRGPLSSLTWVIWRLDWPIQRGRHTFTVRCYDGDGIPQIAQVTPPHPSGATGLHTRIMTF